MFDLVWLYLGAALTALWGVAHLFPTASVVKGFGDISPDNRRIITMQWIVEEVALIFIIKLCPFIFTASTLLILVGGVV